MTGYVVSGLESSISLFTNKFNNLNTHLTPSNNPPAAKIDLLIRRLNLFLDTIRGINNHQNVIKSTCGFPRKLYAFPIWGTIIKNQMTSEFKSKQSHFTMPFRLMKICTNHLLLHPD